MRHQTSVCVRSGLVGLAIFLFLGGFSAAVFAQGGTGTITGTVTDPKGLSVPEAKVSILNTDTGIERPLATTDSGVYTATFLQPGHYQVSVSKDGFSTCVRKDLTLQVGQTLTIDAPLTVGTSVSEITVTGEAPIIEPDRTEVSQTVSQTLASGLPLNGRRWEQFVFLTPGVTNDGTKGLATYHGISGLFNNSSVDGTSNRQEFFSTTRGTTAVGYTYSLDAVREFNVSSSSYSAEFGNAAGGQVNAVTKSGSNDFHGDLFYYLRYPALNALDSFSKSKGIFTQPEHQRQQFGGSGGGPVIKDKLFFFVNYDGQRRSFPIIFTGPSTNNATAAVNGMIASGCASTVNVTTSPGPPPVVTPTPTTIVGITPAQCAAAVNFILGTIGPQPRKGDQDIYLGKLDYQATTNNHLSASFNFMNWNAPNDAQTSPTLGNSSNTTNGTFATHNRYLVANWNTVISPTVVNDFRFQWSRDFEFTSANFGGPSVSVGANSTTGIITYGMPNFLPRTAFPDEHRLQFADSISYVRNKHTIKFGVDISPVHELLINLFQGGGIYTYSYSDTSAATAATTLQAWIADVYNLPLSIDPSTNPATDTRLGKHFNNFTQVKDVLNKASEAGKDDFYDVDYAAYVQDSWKVHPSVTLNLGLRYDVQWIPQPPNPHQNSFANIYTSKINVPKLNFAPRIGFAWQATKTSVFRAGYGIFYANTTNSLFYNTRVENGVVQQTFNCNARYTPSTGSAGSVDSCAPIFPNVIFNTPGPALQAPFAGGVTPTSLSLNPSSLPAGSSALRGQVPDMLQPMVHEGEIAFEQELPGNISASATFMMTHGEHLPVCADANLAPPGTPVTVNGVTVTPPKTITYTTTGFATLFNGGIPAPTGSVTVPFYSSRLNSGVGIVSACQSTVYSNYYGLIATVKKRFGHGFELLTNYTYAKSRDAGQVLGDTGTFNGSSDAPLDPFNQSGEYGTSDYDQRQRFVGSFLYVPTIKIENSVLNYLVNGFGFGGIVTIASPFPVNALISSTVTPSVVVATGLASPATVTVSAPDAGVTGAVEINASTSAGRVPLFPKNSFRGPTQVRNVDFRVTRDIKIWRERYKMQVIAEAFNLFNHTIITAVNAAAYSLTAANPNYTLAPQSAFLTPTASSNALTNSRQLQFSAKLNF